MSSDEPAVLQGSWNLVARVINKVTILTITYKQIRLQLGYLALPAKSHGAPSTLRVVTIIVLTPQR